MKKLLFIFGLLFAIPVFADYPIAHHKMDGSILQATTSKNAAFSMSVYDRPEVPTLKHFIKPFHCKIWTDYEATPGYGIIVRAQALNAQFDGNEYPWSDCRILTKDEPINLQVTFGIVKRVYDPLPFIDVENNGCSPFDSHCTPTTKPVVYISCNLT